MLGRLIRQLLRPRPGERETEEPFERSGGPREPGPPAGALGIAQRQVEIAPRSCQAWCELGLAHRAEAHPEKARFCFERAAKVDPRSVQALLFLGNIHNEAGRLDEAIAAYRRALMLFPDDAGIHFNLALTLLTRGDADGAVAAFRRSLELAPESEEARSSMLFAANLSVSLTAEEVAREHFEWGRRFGGLDTLPKGYTGTADPDRALRIGYVSADFFDHVASRFIRPFLENHDQAQFGVYCYANRRMVRDKGIPGCRWTEVAALSDPEFAENIRRDGIDILVDLSGHTRGNRLAVFASKPAPLQFTFLGYPNTTGMRAMDYRITDRYADPPGASEDRYLERLVRMPNSLWCYAPPGDAPPVSRAPVLANGHVTFGSFNNVAKLNGELIALWSQLLRALPTARILLATVPLGEARESLASGFAAHGIKSSRIEFVARVSPAEFLRLYERADIALDSFPCNGGGTTCEALWMGVPVVTLQGNAFAGRAGASLLRNSDLGELVARSAEEYARIAVCLANDAARLSDMRSTMRDRLARSPLLDAAAYTRDLERIYRDCWRLWCARAAARVA